MTAHIRTRDVTDLARFGDLAFFGAPCVGVDLPLERGYAYSTRPSHAARGSGAVALLKSYAGCFGWRLTNRQAGALARAGFASRSWT